MAQDRSKSKPGALARWSRFAVRHKWQVIGGWVAAIAILVTLSVTVGGEYSTAFKLPGSESQQAIDLLEERFPSASGDSATIVFEADAGIDDPATQAQISALLTQIAAIPEVVGVGSPYENAGQISQSGTLAYASVQFDRPANEVETANVDTMLDLVDAASAPGFTVEAGGQVVAANEIVPPGSSEIIGIAVALLIMIFMFGSVVAAGLPIIGAIVGLGVGLLMATLFANFFTLSESVTDAFIAMIGLGVGIDYVLFIVNRYRDGLLGGLSAEDAAVRAIDTSGRAVIFAGITVAIALLSLSIIGIPFVTGMGIAGALVVLVSVTVAIFLMPAILGVTGGSVLRYRVPGFGRPSRGESTFWHNWGSRIQRRPGIISAVLVVVLLVAAVPYFDMRLGLSDNGNNPESLHSRRAYDLLAEGFGVGVNGPLLIVVEQDGGLDSANMDRLSAALTSTEGVAAVAPPTTNAAGDTAILTLIPTSSPQDAATTDLVNNLRSSTLPGALEGTDISAYVAGSTAANIDLSDQISSRVPFFYLIVIGLSMLLLTIVFRSVIVPLKAALMNLLSIGASFGAVVAVFQWGWFKELIGVSQTGPIESFLPMMLFGIVFGLSMDYEVFLLSRVHEEYAFGRPAKLAMLDGIGFSGKVVAAAGAIMASVFFAFVAGDARVIKELGFGLGFAIVVDAFLVRLILVPAVMTILGDRAWYMPAWLDRILPRLNVEGDGDPLDLEEMEHASLAPAMLVAKPAD